MTSIVVGLYIFQDFLRRLLFVVEAPLKVVIIDVLGFGSLPIILSVLYFFETLSLDSLLVTIASTKIVSILLGIYYTRPFILTSRTIKPTIIIHWKYAKFLFASSILQWFSGNIFVLFSGIFIGPVALGALRVAQNILGILNIFFLFLENSIPIKAAHVLHTSGREKFNRYMLKVFKQHFIVLFIFLIGIYVFQDQLLHLFYGSAMDHFEWLIPAFCGLYILIFFGTILRFVYRTIEKNEVLFYGYITSSILGLAISYPLIQFTGLYGVVVGLFVTQLASLLTYYFHYKFNQ